MSNRKLGIVMDPIGAIKPWKDSSFAMMLEAQKRGFSLDAPGWCNLGQGQPDTGQLPGAPQRVTRIDVRASDLDCAPVAGVWELREAVANL